MRTVSSKVDNSIHDQIVNRCNGIGCSPSQYIKDLIAKDLQAGQPASNGVEVVQGKWNNGTQTQPSRPSYENLPDNSDGSAHVIILDKNGDARAAVKNSDGTTRTWVKHKSSNEWIPVARIVYRL